MVTNNLTRVENEAVINFLLSEMDLPTRLKLMATLPTAYVKLYPQVAAEEVLAVVTNAVAKITGGK